MKQQYHTIIKPESNGWFVGWVEEIPGTHMSSVTEPAMGEAIVRFLANGD